MDTVAGQQAARGLTSVEARRRLGRVGRNALAPEPSGAPLRLLLRQFGNPLVLVLLCAAVIAGLLQEFADAAIVAVVVLASTGLGFAQEFRSSRAVARLRARLQLRCRVLRDGAEVEVPADEIVPGDLVLLRAGSMVPADGELVEARDLHVNEAALTGESLPVSKEGEATDARARRLFMGTSVVSGTATMCVTGTGARTEYGAIAAHLTAPAADTAFELDLRRFGLMLTVLILVLVIAVFAFSILLQRPALEALMFSIALAVGISPELLPAILSVTLARGAREMLARGVLVRRLGAIENLGAMEVLCSDKTGTLTAGVMRLAAATDADGAAAPRVIECAALNAWFESGLVNPLDAALRAAVPDPRARGAAAPRKLDEVPYDFVRRRLSVVVEHPDGRREMLTKGAVEETLAACAFERRAGLVQPLDDARRASVRGHCEAQLGAGFRLLAVASREVAGGPAWSAADERGLCLEGLLLFEDPPRPDAGRVVAELRRLGIALKVVTGDHRLVALHAAREVGLGELACLTGRELDALDDAELRRVAADTDLFAQVDPQQKERIVRALRASGRVVGYLGDGINDAPSLRAADVGISVDGAVDVARESADFVLLERDLDVLRRGVVLGRSTFANTMKYVLATISANFGNMLSMAVASAFMPFLPLLAKQILLNNLLSDLPALAIATDRVDAPAIARPQRWRIDEIRRFMVVFGLLSSAFDLLTFALLYRLTDGDVEAFRTGWFIESLLTEIGVLLVLRTRLRAWRSTPSRALAVSSVLAAAAGVALPWTALGGWFALQPLPPVVLAGVLGVVLAYLIASEATKGPFYRWLDLRVRR